MDAVFAAAEAHDQMLIPVLAPQDGACEDALVQSRDYGADGVPLPGDQWNGLGRRLEQAAALGKPLLVGEIGELAGSCATTAGRASHIAAKIQGQREPGRRVHSCGRSFRTPGPPSAPTTSAPTTRCGTWWSSSEAGVRAPLPATRRPRSSSPGDGFRRIEPGEPVEPGVLARVADVDHEGRSPATVGEELGVDPVRRRIRPSVPGREPE